MAKHRIGRTAVDEPRIVLTARADEQDEPRGRLFDTMDTEQAMALVERLTSPPTRRVRVLQLS